jgi:DNA polymerase III subunit delta
MKLTPDRLTGHLAQQLKPLYTVFGDEPLLVIEASDAIRKAAREQGYTEREVLVAGPGFRWESLAMAAGNLSLFGGDKLIDLRIPNGKPGLAGGEALVRHCEKLGPGAGLITLVTLPQLEWQQRKSAWFDALSSAGVSLELLAPGLAQLPHWIAGRLAQQQQRADTPALEFIAAHVEGNLLAAHQEVQKLALLYPAGELTLAQVEDAVLNVARYDMGKLRDALLEGDRARLIRLIDGLRAEGAAPLLMLWAVTEEARTLARVASGMARGKAQAQLMRENRVYGKREQGLLRALRRLDAPAAMAILRHAADIDRMAKGVLSGNVWDELMRLGLRFG